MSDKTSNICFPELYLNHKNFLVNLELYVSAFLRMAFGKFTTVIMEKVAINSLQ